MYLCTEYVGSPIVNQAKTCRVGINKNERINQIKRRLKSRKMQKE